MDCVICWVETGLYHVVFVYRNSREGTRLFEVGAGGVNNYA